MTTPLKRQPDGSFQAISWYQAIQEIADQLVHIRDTFGGTAFASVGGVDKETILVRLMGANCYTRLLEAMKVIPQQFPILSKIAEKDSAKTAYLPYFGVLAASFAKNKKLIPFAGSIVYRTLGKTLPNDAATTALLLPLCMQYASQHYHAVKQAGYEGNRLNLGVKLFQTILQQRSGVVLSQHDYADVWSLIAYKT